MLPLRLTLLAATALLLACGGGGSSTSISPATPPTSPEFNPTKVTTLAGLPGQSGMDNGSAHFAKFSGPSGMVVDSSGNLYVADELNHCIRKVTPTGEVSTYAGKEGEAGTTDGTAQTARFGNPCGLAIDATNTIYVADWLNHDIRKITPAGEVYHLAGTAGQSGAADGQGMAARFNGPIGLALDTTGNLYVADSGNHLVRRISPSGLVSTLAGSALSGLADGPAASASFGAPFGIAVDAGGAVYVSDFTYHNVRKISGGMVSTFAGDLAGGMGSTDGLGTAARFNKPALLSFDAAGNLFVAQFLGASVRKITPTGNVSTVAGKAGQPGYGTGAISTVSCGRLYAIYIKGQRAYISDRSNYVIQILD